MYSRYRHEIIEKFRIKFIFQSSIISISIHLFERESNFLIPFQNIFLPRLKNIHKFPSLTLHRQKNAYLEIFFRGVETEINHKGLGLVVGWIY